MIFRFMRRSLVVVALAVLSVGVSGCVWLAIPSLAYQGYKYEHPDKTTTSGKRGSTSQSKPTTPSGQPIPQNEIE